MKKELEYLNTVIKYGEIGRAANVLRISTPALSKYIKNLESKMGIELIEKKDKVWRYTLAGERFVYYMTKIDDLETTLLDEMETLKETNAPRVKVFLTGRLFSVIILHAMQRIKEELPQVKIDFFEGKASLAKQMLLDRDIDFAFVSRRGIEGESRFKIISKKLRRSLGVLALVDVSLRPF